MKFELKDPQTETLKDKKKVAIIETENKQIGETSLEELQKALDHHKDIKTQSETAIADLTSQIAEVNKLLK